MPDDSRDVATMPSRTGGMEARTEGSVTLSALSSELATTCLTHKLVITIHLYITASHILKSTTLLRITAHGDHHSTPRSIRHILSSFPNHNVSSRILDLDHSHWTSQHSDNQPLLALVVLRLLCLHPLDTPLFLLMVLLRSSQILDQSPVHLAAPPLLWTLRLLHWSAAEMIARILARVTCLRLASRPKMTPLTMLTDVTRFSCPHYIAMRLRSLRSRSPTMSVLNDRNCSPSPHRSLHTITPCHIQHHSASRNTHFHPSIRSQSLRYLRLTLLVPQQVHWQGNFPHLTLFHLSREVPQCLPETRWISKTFCRLCFFTYLAVIFSLYIICFIVFLDTATLFAGVSYIPHCTLLCRFLHFMNGNKNPMFTAVRIPT